MNVEPSIVNAGPVLPRCAVALCCANVTFQGGTQAPNYHEVMDVLNVPTVPVALDRIFPVFEFKDGMPGVYRTKLRVDGPNGFVFEQPLMDISFTTELYNARVAIETRQFVFPTLGRYKFALHISNHEAGFFTLDIRAAVRGQGFSVAPQGQATMIERLQYSAPHQASETVNQNAIRSASVIYAGVLQTPLYGVVVAVPDDVKDSAAVIINDLASLRSGSLDAIGD